MTQLTHDQYNTLEHAVAHGTRIVVHRKGRRQYVIIPLRLHVQGSREAIEARNPTTGHELTLYLDEVDAIEVVK